MSKNNSERRDRRRKTAIPKAPAEREEPGADEASLDAQRARDRWTIIQQQLREQADLFRTAETVRETVEVMLQTEVEGGTRDEDEPMTRVELDKRKQRIKDWLGHLVRLQLAEENVALAKAKFELTKTKVNGGAVQVTPEVLLDHQALVSWLRKRPELFEEFQGERDGLNQ